MQNRFEKFVRSPGVIEEVPLERLHRRGGGARLADSALAELADLGVGLIHVRDERSGPGIQVDRDYAGFTCHDQSSSRLPRKVATSVSPKASIAASAETAAAGRINGCGATVPISFLFGLWPIMRWPYSTKFALCPSLPK